MARTKVIKKKLTPAEKMLNNKRKLVQRLEREIENVRASADKEVSTIRKRISIAKALIQALEQGTLNL